MKRVAVLIAGLSSIAVPLAHAQEDAPEPAVEEGSAREDDADDGEIEPLSGDPEVFERAISDYYSESYADAAAGFWRYIKYGEETDDQREWAQFFMGESLAKLGMWHGAAIYYYTVAKNRSRPEILPEALRRLRDIAERRPISEELVYRDLLYDSEFGALPEDLANWVEYVQGLFDYRNEFVQWADKHFKRISSTDTYFLKSLYVRGVYSLKKNRDDEALAAFDSVVESKLEGDAIKNRANLALARLLFDKGEYEAAADVYERIKQIDLSFEQAELLLEKAWVAYHLKNYRRAMGLLHALKAPSYEKFFLPDAFLLRGLILKKLCHFIPAKRVVRDFRFRHKRALDALRQRAPLERVRVLLHAATQEGMIARRTEFLKSIQEERAAIENYDDRWEDDGLDAHLRQVYDLELKEQERLWRSEFEVASDRVALLLLEAEEQIDLLDYEIGLDIFKRLNAADAKQAKENKLVIPFDSKNIFYEFDTEFWNDELHSYKFFVNSRCFEGEGDG